MASQEDDLVPVPNISSIKNKMRRQELFREMKREKRKVMHVTGDFELIPCVYLARISVPLRVQSTPGVHATDSASCQNINKTSTNVMLTAFPESLSRWWPSLNVDHSSRLSWLYLLINPYDRLSREQPFPQWTMATFLKNVILEVGHPGITCEHLSAAPVMCAWLHSSACVCVCVCGGGGSSGWLDLNSVQIRHFLNHTFKQTSRN